MPPSTISDEKWREIQLLWEKDERPGFKWLVEELDLPVSPQALGGRARRKEWKKTYERKLEAGELQKRVRAGISASGDGKHETFSNMPVAADGKQGEGDDGKRGVGRPSRYREDYCAQVYTLCLLGLVDKEIAEFFLVCEKTLNNWKKEHPEFLQSMQRGRLVADAEVAQSVYKRATGHNCDAVHVSAFMGDVTLTKIEKHYPPDPQSQRFWLNNRQPALWRLKNEAPPAISDEDMVSYEELDALYDQSLEESRRAAEAVRDRGARLGVTIEHVSDVGD